VCGAPGEIRTPDTLIRSQENTLFTQFHKTSNNTQKTLIYLIIDAKLNYHLVT